MAWVSFVVSYVEGCCGVRRGCVRYCVPAPGIGAVAESEWRRKSVDLALERPRLAANGSYRAVVSFSAVFGVVAS